MDLTEARAVVLQFARNAQDDTDAYDDDEVDRAIQFVGNHFVRETGILRSVSSIALAAGDGAVDLSDLVGFRPERFLSAYLDGVRASQLRAVAWEEVNGVTDAGRPLVIAFEDWTTAAVRPVPDQAYTLKLRWAEPFTVWTAGDESPDDVELNLPDDVLAEILPYGPPAVLQHNEEENRYASEDWKRYLLLVERMKGVGELAARTSRRASAWGAGASAPSGGWPPGVY